MAHRLFRMLLVLWSGSLWATVWVALIIFNAQPDRHLSGVIAARLFGIETYLGVAVATGAALAGLRSQFRPGYVAAALLLVNEWALKPLMDRALRTGSALSVGFGAWHGVSALLYLSACIAVSVYIYNESSRSA